MRSTRFVSLLFGLLVLPTAQGASLQGIVSDPQGTVVPGAELRLHNRLSGAEAAAQSDGSGAYHFPGVAPGTYLLEVEAAGSALGASSAVQLTGDQHLDVELEIRGLRTEVLVTASATPMSVDETAKAITVVDSAEMEKRLERTVAESVRNVPGVRVQSRGPGGFTTVQARGLRIQDTAVLVDGLRFRDAASIGGDATAFYQDMTLVDTDRIEFLRGSGSSLYGSNAIGGVLNVVSAQGGGKTHGAISAEGGGLGLFRGVARIGGGLGGQDRFIYSAGITHLNVTQGIDDFDPHRNTGGQGFAKYNFTPNVSLSGRVWATDAFVALNESVTFTDEVLANVSPGGVTNAVALPDAERERFERGEPFTVGNATFIPAFNDPDNHRRSSFLAGAAIFTHEFSPNSSYRISYHGVDTNRALRDGPAGAGAFDPVFPNESRFDGRIDTVQVRTDNRIGAHHLVTLGYEYEREETLGSTTDENPDPSLRPVSSTTTEQSSHTVFAQDQIRAASGRLQLALSGRMQAFDLSTPAFTGGLNPYRGVGIDSPPTALTGDAAIAYFFRSSGTKLRAHAGNGYRAPSGFNRYGGSFSSFSGSFSFWGDPRLSPERSVGFDTGIDQWFLDSQVQLSGTFFYTNLQEIITFDFGIIDPGVDPFGRFGGYRNSGGGLARGAEFSMRAAPSSRSTLAFSYTYTNSDSREPTVPGTDFFEVLGVSGHLLSMTATHSFSQRFEVAFDLFAASDYPLRFFGAPGRFTLDGPVKADVVMSYSVPVAEGAELKFYGKVENVFDNRYFEDGFGTPGLWALGGLKFSF